MPTPLLTFDILNNEISTSAISIDQLATKQALLEAGTDFEIEIKTPSQSNTYIVKKGFAKKFLFLSSLRVFHGHLYEADESGTEIHVGWIQVGAIDIDGSQSLFGEYGVGIQRHYFYPENQQISKSVIKFPLLLVRGQQFNDEGKSKFDLKAGQTLSFAGNTSGSLRAGNRLVFEDVNQLRLSKNQEFFFEDQLEGIIEGASLELASGQKIELEGGQELLLEAQEVPITSISVRQESAIEQVDPERPGCLTSIPEETVRRGLLGVIFDWLRRLIFFKLFNSVEDDINECCAESRKRFNNAGCGCAGTIPKWQYHPATYDNLPITVMFAYTKEVSPYTDILRPLLDSALNDIQQSLTNSGITPFNIEISGQPIPTNFNMLDPNSGDELRKFVCSKEYEPVRAARTDENIFVLITDSDNGKSACDHNVVSLKRLGVGLLIHEIGHTFGLPDYGYTFSGSDPHWASIMETLDVQPQRLNVWSSNLMDSDLGTHTTIHDWAQRITDYKGNVRVLKKV